MVLKKCIVKESILALISNSTRFLTGFKCFYWTRLMPGFPLNQLIRFDF